MRSRVVCLIVIATRGGGLATHGGLPAQEATLRTRHQERHRRQAKWRTMGAGPTPPSPGRSSVLARVRTTMQNVPLVDSLGKFQTDQTVIVARIWTVGFA